MYWARGGGLVCYLAVPTLVSCALARPDRLLHLALPSTSTFASTSLRPAPAAARPTLPAKKPFACSPTSRILGNPGRTPQAIWALMRRFRTHTRARTTLSPGSCPRDRCPRPYSRLCPAKLARPSCIPSAQTNFVFLDHLDMK
jgi:hypothetical protein